MLCAAFLVLTSASWTASPPAQTAWFVSSTATPPYLGTAAQPFADIEQAITHPGVLDGHRIWVGPGAYPGFRFHGKSVTVQSVQGASATQVGPVQFLDGESSASVLRGFTVLGGGGTDVYGTNGPTWAGGCIASLGAPTIESCLITGANIDTWWFAGGDALGGGVFTTGPMTLTDCTIRNNRLRTVDEGYAAGGGVYGPAVLINCVVEDNSVAGDPIGSPNGEGVCGGGTAYATLDQCVVRNNTVSGPNTTGVELFQGHAEGGGIFGGSATDCTIEGNRVFAQARDDFANTDLGFGGGAARATLSDCVVRGNQVVIQGPGIHGPNIAGGGVYRGSASGCEIYDNLVEASFGGGKSSGGGAAETQLARCVARDNLADWGGGASAAATIVSCTLFRNQARLGGGGASECASLNSSIVWGNLPDAVHAGAAATVLAYCDIDDACWATGTNFESDPEFWNPSANDLHLRPGSPCIDTGDPTLPTDADGTRVDLGAHPYDAYYCSTALAYCTAKTNSAGCVPQVAAFGGNYGGPWAPSLWITCDNVLNQKTGLFFFGMSGRASAPFLGGTLCVAGPTIRTMLQSSGGSTSGVDCSGVLALDFGAWIASGITPALVPGAQVNGQFWYRDPLASSTAGLSDGIELIVCR